MLIEAQTRLSVREFRLGNAEADSGTWYDDYQPRRGGSMKDEPIRILLVEDDASFVFLLKRALDAEHFRYDLITLSDGAEALAFIRKQRKSGRRQPALIVMDLHLPKEDGIEILKELRRSAAFSDVPVAILSSSVSP
ncbi:MAG: response regulator, partial [Terriglobia bacterium]